MDKLNCIPTKKKKQPHQTNRCSIEFSQAQKQNLRNFEWVPNDAKSVVLSIELSEAKGPKWKTFSSWVRVSWEDSATLW